MRAKNNKKKMKLSTKLIYILLLSIVCVNLSLARYKTTQNNSAIATAATWNFKVSIDDEILSQTFQINLANTMTANNNINEGVLAPGSTGDFTLNIDCSRM